LEEEAHGFNKWQLGLFNTHVRGLMTIRYPKRRSDVGVRVVDGETVVFDRHRGLIHQLNLTAHSIWERCDGTSSIAEIVQHLSEAFGVDPQTADADVAALIAQLHTLELLEPQDSSERPVEFDL
jgi:PqqD family protein of HPr-rel-A system